MQLFPLQKYGTSVTFSGLIFLPVLGKSGNFRGFLRSLREPRRWPGGPRSSNEVQAYPKDSKIIAHMILVKLTLPGLYFLPVFAKSGDFRGLPKEFKEPKELSRGSKEFK